jgi:hypothetical protein
MRLDEQNDRGETLYECDTCQITGARDSCILEEAGRHFCFSCWYEKERLRPRREKTVVEI